MIPNGQDLNETLEALKQNPLFYLSLGSKELFHSDFIQWLCVAHPRLVSAALSEYLYEDTTSSQAVADREKHNLDLVLRLPGFAPLVVENKVKSLVRVEQLDKYDQRIASSFRNATKMVLSFGSPWESGCYKSWRHLSYESFADALEFNVAATVSPAFDRALVERYVAMVRDLAKVASHARVSDLSEDYIGLEHYKALKDARLHDLYYKIRADHLASLITNRLEQLAPVFEGSEEEWVEQLTSNPSFFVGTAFTRGTAMINVYARSCTTGYTVGLQVQNGQFRLCMIVPTKGTSKAARRAEREKVASGCLFNGRCWFEFHTFDGHACPEGATDAPTEQDGFLGFDPGFVYRYKRIGPRFTVTKLLEVVVAYAKLMLDHCQPRASDDPRADPSFSPDRGIVS